MTHPHSGEGDGDEVKLQGWYPTFSGKHITYSLIYIPRHRQSSAEVKFPLNHIWGYHDACEGNGKYSLYDNAIRKRYGEPKDLADYIKKGQLVNAENYRAVFESVNHAMERVAGVILWKANPAWPSVMWQLYDWYLSPNAGYYYTKKHVNPSIFSSISMTRVSQ